MTKQQQFFYDHAGTSYTPAIETKEQGKVRTAIALAKAEAWATSEGFWFSLENDDDYDDSFMTPEERKKPHLWQGVVLRAPDGETAQSLWGICDADTDYLRVVRAELALEAMPVEVEGEAK